MTSLLILVPCTLLAISLIFRLVRWISNYVEARKLGLPILLSPFSWQEPLYMILGPYLSFLQHLPFGLGAWTQYTLMGWPINKPYDLHLKYGPAFVIVSPVKTEIILADPAAAEEVLIDWKSWTKSPEMFGIFEVFGKNVVSVNGEDWLRHRKITAPAFKESNYHMVWESAIQQTEQMSRLWCNRGEVTLRKISEDAALLAMHVLAYAGFGKEYDFHGEALDVVEEGHKLSYGKSLRTILDNVMFVLLFSGLKAPDWLLPRTLKNLKIATSEFKKYMFERIDEERDSTQKAQKSDNLISTLVRANEAAKNETGSKMILSHEELLGNLFVFNLAGHETTASSLAFALPWLAALPDVQRWIAEEIDANADILTVSNYHEAYHKLVRTQALMYETVRHYSAAQALAKYSGEASRHLKIGETDYVVPPHSYVTINFGALLLNPNRWGKNANAFHPQRFIVVDEKTAIEELHASPDGVPFVAWSSGPRICPGKKFSQVEFVGVIATILRKYRIKPAVRGKESVEEATRRLVYSLKDVTFNMTPKARSPNMAGIVLVER